MSGQKQIIEPWMLGALTQFGNVLIGERKMKRHGMQAYIEGFAPHGYTVEIKKSKNRDGYISRGFEATQIKRAKMNSYIVSVIGKERKDDQ